MVRLTRMRPGTRITQDTNTTNAAQRRAFAFQVARTF